MTEPEGSTYNCPSWCVADHIADLAVDIHDGLDRFTLTHATNSWSTAGSEVTVRLERWDVEGKVGASEVNISIRDRDLTANQARELAAELCRLAGLAGQT